MATFAHRVSAALEKLSKLSASANATFSFCQSSSKMQNISSDTTKKESVSNAVERSRGSMRSKTEGYLNKSTTAKPGEHVIFGGGDASIIMETCKKFSNIRLSNSKIQKSTSK